MGTKSKISLLAAILAVICYLFLDSDVAKVIIFKQAGDIFWNLPQEIIIPKWWDLLATYATIYLTINWFVFLSQPKHRIEESYIGAILGVLFGTLLSVWFLIKGGLDSQLQICFIIGASIYSLIGLVFSLHHQSSGLRFTSASSITTGLTIGIIVGLKTGFVFSLIAGVLICLGMMIAIWCGSIIGSFIKYLASKRCWDVFKGVLSGEIQ